MKKIKKMRRFAQKISSSYEKAIALITIAKNTNADCDWEKAKEVVYRINDFKKKEKTYKAIAVGLTQVGRIDEVKEMAKDNRFKSTILIKVIETLAQEGKSEEAKKIMREYRFEELHRILISRVIARGFVEAGDREKAIKFADSLGSLERVGATLAIAETSGREEE